MMQIVYKSLSEIKPYENNPRNNEKAVSAVAASIQAFGWLVPLVIDSEGVIVCGHTRYKAAVKLGIDNIPCVLADDLTEEQARAFRLADNKTAELAVWDLPLLEGELDDIGDTIDMNQFGFTLGVTDIYEPDNTTQEIDINNYSDDEFEYECPECGFRFNDYE